MSKPSTPVRRSKVGPGRPGSAGGEIPLTASMEVLTPDPCVPPHMAASELGCSQDLYVAPAGSKPRTPGSANLVRTRSTDGRRSAHAAPHGVIPLNSTTSKSSSANHLQAHPLVLPSAGPSPASSIIGAPGAAGLPPQSPYACGPAHGSTAPSCAVSSSSGGILAQHATVRARTPPEIAISRASSRFNPVVEDDDALPPLAAQQLQQSRQQPQLQASSSGATAQQDADPATREPHVVLSGSAVAFAQRVTVSSGGSSSRRYAATDSVALSTQQQRQHTGEGGGDGVGHGEVGAGTGRYQQDESEVPATPGSVASGRVGGVFFTDLHRSFGGSRGRGGVGDLRGAFGNDGEGDDDAAEMDGDGDGGPRASRQARISTMTSRLNPMQSPTTSEDGDEDDEDDAAFAEYAGEALPPAVNTSGGAEEGGGGRASTSAMTDYTNPVQTPYDSRLATPLLPSAAGAAPAPEPSTAASEAAAASSSESRQSLLLVIRDLYVTEPQQQPRTPVEHSRPATAASEPPAPAAEQTAPPVEGPGDEGEDEGEGERDESEALAASRAAVAALAARTDSRQSQRRSELGEYITALQELKDESGGRLVELPADWGVMLERLFRQRRAEFATLEGWMGPRRFEDLPINQLPSDHPDPRVEEGLARIRELDSVLNDKLIAALISHRETFPDQWAEQERKRLERHTKAVEEALKRERQKRLRAARISRAVTSLDGPAAMGADPSAGRGGMGQGSSRSLVEQPSSIYSRMFTLKPEEEALVEAVLQRNDEEGAAINPFDLESAATYGGGPEAAAAVGAGEAAAGEGVWAEADDIDIELDMLLPSASASACATPSAGAAPRLRPLSARRLTEADGGGGGSGLRPLSASSYSSSSRPGTSSGGLIGGMSALAAAALHGHPALLAAAGVAAGGGGGPRASAAGGAGGLLPERVYDDPRAAARALRAINARLAAFESEHLWDESGALADFKSVTAQQQQQQPGRSQQQSAAEASAGPGIAAATGAAAAAGTAAGTGAQPSSTPGPRAQSPPRSVKSAAGGPAASVSGVSVTAGGQRDYLREERLAKELASRERDVDSALRSLKTGEVVRLGEATLKALVEQCRRLQELNEHRRKIEEAEAAARKAQLQRQQLLASRASSETGSARGTPRGASTPRTSGNSRGQIPPLPAGATRAEVASTPTDGGAAAGGGGRSAKPGGAAAASSGSPGGGSVGVAAAATGGGGGGAPVRQGSAGRARSGSTTAGTSSSSGPAPAARRASDPASATATSGVAGTSTTTSGSAGSGSSSSSKAGRTSAAAAPVGPAAAATSAGVPKPRSAGKAVGPLSPLDGGGGLPPPPPPPPP